MSTPTIEWARKAWAQFSVPGEDGITMSRAALSRLVRERDELAERVAALCRLCDRERRAVELLERAICPDALRTSAEWRECIAAIRTFLVEIDAENKKLGEDDA